MGVVAGVVLVEKRSGGLLFGEYIIYAYSDGTASNICHQRERGGGGGGGGAGEREKK